MPRVTRYSYPACLNALERVTGQNSCAPGSGHEKMGTRTNRMTCTICLAYALVFSALLTPSSSTSSWMMQSGYPTPDSSNKLCATNGQQGTVVGSAALCEGAFADGTIGKILCDRVCIELRCFDDSNCVGYGEDTNLAQWRPVSQISGVVAHADWQTFPKPAYTKLVSKSCITFFTTVSAIFTLAECKSHCSTIGCTYLSRPAGTFDTQQASCWVTTT